MKNFEPTAETVGMARTVETRVAEQKNARTSLNNMADLVKRSLPIVYGCWRKALQRGWGVFFGA